MSATVEAIREAGDAAYAQGVKLNRLDTWAFNIGEAVRTARNENRPAEAAFWARAYADILESLLEATDGADAASAIVCFEDIMERRKGKLRAAIRADEARTPGPANRISQNTLTNMRRNALRSFL